MAPSLAPAVEPGLRPGSRAKPRAAHPVEALDKNGNLQHRITVARAVTLAVTLADAMVQLRRLVALVGGRSQNGSVRMDQYDRRRL